MISRIFKRLVSTVRRQPLISEPFKFDNTRKLRDTNQVFPKPNFISFDAFGTLYTPKKPVYEQYFEIASDEFGIDKSQESIKNEFPIVHKQLLQEFPNYGKNSGKIDSLEQWWLELIVRLFDINHYTKDSKSQEFCQRLINHFESSEGYHLYEDVIPTVSKLKEHNFHVVVSSNSDARIYKVLESFGLSDYIKKPDIYISYNLLHEKPHKTFFDMVSNAQILRSKGSLLPKDERSEYLENCWHVGDGHDKDFLGAVRAGWNGIFLDRSIQSRYLTQEIPDSDADATGCITKPKDHPNLGSPDKPIQFIANNRVIISDLTQLIQLFNLQ